MGRYSFNGGEIMSGEAYFQENFIKPLESNKLQWELDSDLLKSDKYVIHQELTVSTNVFILYIAGNRCDFKYRSLENCMQAAQDYEDSVSKQSKPKKKYLNIGLLIARKNHLSEIRSASYTSDIYKKELEIRVNVMTDIIDCFGDED